MPQVYILLTWMFRVSDLAVSVRLCFAPAVSLQAFLDWQLLARDFPFTSRGSVMNRSVLCGVAGLAMLVAFAMSTADQKAHAGLFGGLFKKGCCAPAPVCCEPAPAPVCCEPAPSCGGLFKKKACGGGLFAKLKARKAAKSCCAPAPVCCEPAPAPVCCAPAPVCYEPAPVCCEPAPVSDCCGGSVVMGEPMMMTEGMVIESSVVVPAAVPTDLPAAAAEATSEVPPTPEA
jgi:hypothetical protein